MEEAELGCLGTYSGGLGGFWLVFQDVLVDVGVFWVGLWGR